MIINRLSAIGSELASDMSKICDRRIITQRSSLTVERAMQQDLRGKMDAAPSDDYGQLSNEASH
jgi:hypothetical protein